MDLSEISLESLVITLLGYLIKLLSRLKINRRGQKIGVGVTGPIFGIPPREVYTYDLSYLGVLWKVCVYEQHKPRFLDISLDVKVTIPPKCPNCRTELEESKCFFRKYCWECVKCGFKKRNKDDFTLESQRVTRIARSELKT